LTYKHTLRDHESEEFAVVPSDVEKILRACEETLGMETHDVPRIVPRPESSLVGLASSYRPKKGWIESESFEYQHNMFHELVHYLMHQEDLLMTETVADDGPFLNLVYAHLIDETVAEFSTYSTCGYNPNLISSPFENKLADALIDNVSTEEVEDCVLKLGKSPFLNPDYWTAIRVVAINNATTLQVEPSELVSRVIEAKEKYSSPIEIYHAITKNPDDLQLEVLDDS
jgi:hypothetical protein